MEAPLKSRSRRPALPLRRPSSAPPRSVRRPRGARCVRAGRRASGGKAAGVSTATRDVRRIATRPATRATSSRLCVESSTACRSSRSRTIRARTLRALSGSRPDVGSSRSTIVGFVQQRSSERDALPEALRELRGQITCAIADIEHRERLFDRARGSGYGHTVWRRSAGSGAPSADPTNRTPRSGSRSAPAVSQRSHGRGTRHRSARIPRMVRLARPASSASSSCPRRSVRAGRRPHLARCRMRRPRRPLALQSGGSDSERAACRAPVALCGAAGDDGTEARRLSWFSTWRPREPPSERRRIRAGCAPRGQGRMPPGNRARPPA